MTKRVYWHREPDSWGWRVVLVVGRVGVELQWNAREVYYSPELSPRRTGLRLLLADKEPQYIAKVLFNASVQTGGTA